MGQARIRGSRDERIKQALTRHLEAEQARIAERDRRAEVERERIAALSPEEVAFVREVEREAATIPIQRGKSLMRSQLLTVAALSVLMGGTR